MCDRSAQCHSREKYLSSLGEEAERDIPYGPRPVGRYDVAPRTQVLPLSEHRPQLRLDPACWEYASKQWNKPAPINTEGEVVIGSRMFGLLQEHGRAIVFADGWFEWKQQNGAKQPFFIYRKDENPLLPAAIGKPSSKSSNDQEGFPIVTVAADEGLLGIHDR